MLIITIKIAISACSLQSSGQQQQAGTLLFIERVQTFALQQVDEAVNKYPCHRVFTAIGPGSNDFKHSMVASVESALNCKVHPEAIEVKASRTGKYFSVRIGPMMVSDAEEVIAVYRSMKQDERMKWFL
jgi:putative lipoic acid-binding regulatory protein